MPQFLHLPPAAQGVIAISAVALAITRLLTASKPFWAWEKVPVWVQKALPAALMAFAALPTAIEHARNWLDIIVGIVITAGTWFMASRGDKRPPVDKDGGPRLDRVNSDPKLTREELSRVDNERPVALKRWRHPDWRFAIVLLVGCSSVPITSKRCSFDNPEYSAHVATCRKEIEDTCALNADGTPKADCPALLRCEAWRKEQCS